tara:strand:+ start:2177 stop:4450 length:2274 start_codon:yes stop_codon:yes gene_type:complete
VINEFMSKNETTIQDLDGDFSDWLEIYNVGGFELNLEGFYLSDDSDDITKWQFPSVIIPAGGHLLIYASEKDLVVGTELHTNFRISQSGEPLILSNSSAEVVSAVPSIWLAEDKSYARIVDGSNQFIATENSTPGQTNILPNAIISSHTSGYYASPFTLELTANSDNTEIRYTLNGSLPTAESQVFSQLDLGILEAINEGISYIPTTPLEGPYQLEILKWKTPTEVKRCHVIRYASFSGEEMLSEVHTSTYFIGPQMSEAYSFPVVSLVTDSLNLFDYETGIYIPGERHDIEGWNWWPYGNYHNRGREWEREMHISYFHENGKLALETKAGMRMRGLGSTSNSQKSFNVYFRDEYGLDVVDLSLFPDSASEKFKRLTFRNSGQDFLQTHFKDPLLQRIAAPLDLDLQAFKPAVLYINGEYWGIHNIREKYDKHHFNYQYGVDADEVNVLEICGEIDEGDNTEYLDLLAYLDDHSLEDEENYSYVSDRVDISNLIDFQIAEIYFANYDWPCNNFKIWKSNAPESKWRFLIFDLDLSFGFSENSAPSVLSLEHASSESNDWPNCPCSNKVFRKLLENENFRNRFVERFAYCQKNVFDAPIIEEVIDEFVALYLPEMVEHIDRWHYPMDIFEWYNQIETLRRFSKERPCYVEDNVRSFFELESYDFDCSISIVEDSENEVVVYPNPTSGGISLFNNSSSNFEHAELTVHNSTGNLVKKFKEVNIPKGTSVDVNLESLSAGIYLLSILTSGSVKSIKLVIE